MIRTKRIQRKFRRQRVRRKVIGRPGCPRLAIFRSLHHISAQLIDDSSGATLAAASTGEKALKQTKSNVEGAKQVGMLIAERALAKNIKKVVFDRAGYAFHGRVKAVAEAAREKGLEF